MFQGGSYAEAPNSARREASFSLGWDQSNQLNSYQIRKGRDSEVTGKITNNVLQPVQLRRDQDQSYDQALQREKSRQLYERLSNEHPDIPSEELQKYIYQQEQQRRQLINQRPRELPSSHGQMYERRAPIRQKQSMKDIIFNGVGTGDMSSEEQRAASRRNHSNFVLGNNGY